MIATRYDAVFARLGGRREGAFIPFVTLGDPSPTLCESVLAALVEAGADAVELGLPFSDPVADGPVIQAAATRALASGATVDRCFQSIAGLRLLGPELPIGLLVYANLVWRRGLETFYRDASIAGVDSVLVADVPLEELAPFRDAALAAGVAPVAIVPPNANDARLAAIARATAGYTYVTTRSGVTGDDGRPDPALARILGRLEELGAPPAVLGFGVRDPADVRHGIAIGAAGVVAGSAVVRRVAQHRGDPARLADEVGAFVRAMKQATRPKPTAV